MIFRQSLPADASPADSRIGMRTAPHCGAMPENAATNRIEVSPQITSLYWARIADLSDGSGDSDGDGLSDCEELFVYGTDPRERDTDFDGLSDGEEIALGTGPLDAYSVSQTLCDKQPVQIRADSKTDRCPAHVGCTAKICKTRHAHEQVA